MIDIPECTMCKHADSMCLRGMPSCYYERKPKMTKDKELVEKMAEYFYGGLDNLSPFDKECRLRKVRPMVSLCRQHDMQMAIEAVESRRIGTNKDDHIADRYYDKAIDDSEEAIRERFKVAP